MVVLILSFFILSLSSTTAGAAGYFDNMDSDRSMHREFYLQGFFMFEDYTHTPDDLTGNVTYVYMDRLIGGGFGGGFNFNEMFNVNTGPYYANSSIVLERPGVGTSRELSVDILGWDLNLDVNLLKKKITPFVTAGIGAMNFTIDFDHNETDFSFNTGGGVRWDISDLVFAKLFYKGTWVKLEDMGPYLTFQGVFFNLGIMWD